jgi:hypothetical protein
MISRGNPSFPTRVGSVQMLATSAEWSEFLQRFASALHTAE